MPTNNALQRTSGHRGRPVLAKGWRARRGGRGSVPAAELDRQLSRDMTTGVHYESGESPKAGDTVSLIHGRGPSGRVVVVVGPELESVPGHVASEWAYLGPGILIEAEGMGLVFDDKPHESVVLVKRDS